MLFRYRRTSLFNNTPKSKILHHMRFLVPFFCLLIAGSTNAYSQRSPTDIRQQVDAILARMDLDDKVGEMTQLTIEAVSVGGPDSVAEPHRLDPVLLRRALVEYRVGSILNAAGHAYPLEHWRAIITQIQEVATKERRSGIPVLYGIDAVHGANYTLGATRFPQQLALACSWNPALAETVGRITAYETRASYIPWTFAPVMDIGRDPRWPRLWETFGEDVLLAQVMGEAFVQGLQGSDPSDPYRVAACLKHFAGYSMPRTGKDRSPVYLAEREFREYVLPPFQRAMQAGAATVMICSGEMNGIPVHADEWVLKQILRDELGFEGLAVSDWEDVKYLVDRHRVAADYKEAIKMAVNAGMDMAMTPLDLDFPRLLKELVLEGAVPMSRIDEAVRRILGVKVRLGLFEHPLPAASVRFDQFASDEHAATNLRIASECLVLLKNEGQTLPISKQKRVLVAGPTAHKLESINGGWSGTWQGTNPAYDTPGKWSIAQAMLQKGTPERVRHIPWAATGQAHAQAVAQAARSADVVVLCLGEGAYTEKPGDINDLSLPEDQQAFVRAVAQAGKPIVLLLAQGRPRIISPIEPLAGAVVLAPLPGDEGGRAVADLLYGDAEPSGRLVFTYPKYPNDLLTYDHKGTEQISTAFGRDAFQPQWPFGHGLTYTAFAYDSLKLSAPMLHDDAPLLASVTVRNTGQRPGHEVVQWYVTDHVASVTPSVRRLRGFEKVYLLPGESRTVQLRLSPEQLAFVGRQNHWITEPGAFTISVGGLAHEFHYLPQR